MLVRSPLAAGIAYYASGLNFALCIGFRCISHAQSVVVDHCCETLVVGVANGGGYRACKPLLFSNSHLGNDYSRSYFFFSPLAIIIGNSVIRFA